MSATSANTILKLSNISGGYSINREIVSGLNFEMQVGERIGIIGQNGAGKSTIGKIIMGLLPYYKGSIVFNLSDITNFKSHERAGLGIGYFYQGGRIFPNLSVQENLKIASLTENDLDKQKKKESYFEELELFNNSKRLKMKAGFLSGGEKNQLALAMVILSVSKLSLLIADEPSAGLSPVNTKAMYKSLNNLVENEKCSLLLIEQNQKFAQDNSNKLFKLTNNKLIQI